MGVKADSRSILINASKELIEELALPRINLVTKLSGMFDYIVFFATTQAQLERKFSALRKHLCPTGMLWISWQKGRKGGEHLTLTTIIKIGYDHGLVESKTLSINATSSAIKFTHPIKGKIYNNSYGKLKQPLQ